MSEQSSKIGFSRLALLAVALLLPAASLIPLGSIWLWQNGLILYWAFGTCVVVALAYYLERRLIGPLPVAAPERETMERGDDTWTPLQKEAWNDIQMLASAVTAERLTSREAAMSLALEAIEVVARRLHPERHDPLLQFTVPEALALIERASVNLRSLLITSFPLGDRITVAQLAWLYRWRGAVALAESGYELWRIIRLLNPVAAATQELRERFTRQIYETGREHIAQRFARAFVEEVGRAAIDLYGGNLRVTEAELAGHVTIASRMDAAAERARAAEPMRILVAGQTGSGKSSLVNALANAVEAAVDALPTTASFAAYRLTHAGIPAALVVDSPGLPMKAGIDALIAATDDCDMVLWVSSAARASRDADAKALTAIRSHLAAALDGHRPPILLVLTHVDALRPFNEWNPPYDLADAMRDKSRSIREAMEAAGAELGFSGDEIVPVRVDTAAPYNIDALWAKLIELMPLAKRARLLRTLDDIKSASGWGVVWSQAVKAGRVIKGTILTRGTSS